jgi:hypothetical protein
MKALKTVDHLVKTLLMVALGVTAAHASDSVAVYARVDKVVLEPHADSPETIQVWGVFSLARAEWHWNARTYRAGDDYFPPSRGYLYFKLAGDRETARKEWADLERVAGTGQIVSFGSRYRLHAQLRAPNQRPENPDPYVVSLGLTRIRENTEYPPIRTLIDFKH